MKEVVLITGANGHLAKVLSQHLKKDYTIRFLTTKKTFKRSHYYWNIKTKYIDQDALKNCNHIIHLAGYPILKKWSAKNKSIIYESRINSTKILLDKCRLLDKKPKTFICASAIGIYKQNPEEEIHEESKKGNDWVAKMALDWENSAKKFVEIGSRVVQLRISLIFSEKSGFLKYNLLSMKYGIGLILGDPKRNINWMHADDISRFIKECIKDNKYSGAYNIASDENISQEEFIREIKKNLFPYAIIIKIPTLLINFLLGQRSKIINTNITLVNNKLKKNGFKCKWNSLAEIIKKIKVEY